MKKDSEPNARLEARRSKLVAVEPASVTDRQV